MMMSPTDGVVEKNPNGSESEDVTTPKNDQCKNGMN